MSVLNYLNAECQVYWHNLLVDSARYSEKRPVIGGTIRSFKSIIKDEGVWRGLYRGVSPNMAGATFSWGFYFGWYSLIKKYMTKDDEGKLSAVQHLTASAEAGNLRWKKKERERWQRNNCLFNCM